MTVLPDFDRYIAVDWSGAKDKSHTRKIWSADLHDGVCKLTSGRSREAVTSWLAHVYAADKRTLVGLDFAFSAPAFYLDKLHDGQPRNLWAAWQSQDFSAKLLEDKHFWGIHGRRDPTHPAEGLRQTEAYVRRTHQLSPYSVFRLVGARQVGLASLRGFQTLSALQQTGYAIWPFDAVSETTHGVVVEIYPAIFSKGTVKSNAASRKAHLERLRQNLPAHPALTGENISHAERSDDAFDALISVVALSTRKPDFSATGCKNDAHLSEGWIYAPAEAPLPPLN